MFVSDGQTFGVFGALKQFGNELLLHAVLHALAQAQFFDHDGTLGIDIGRVQGQAMCPIFQHFHAHGDVFGVDTWNRKDVHRFIERGVRIQIRTELQPHRLQIRDQLVLFEVGRAIESHVLQQMGQAFLVIVFHG